MTDTPGVFDPAALADMIAASDLVPAEVAQLQLSCSHGDLLDLLGTGRLDGIVCGGAYYVFPTQLAAYVADQAGERTRALRALLPGLRYALSGYLGAHVATGDYRTALEEGRPLVCARRGRVYLEHGLRMHTIAVPVAGIGRWAGEEVARLWSAGSDPGVDGQPMMTTRAALSRVPTGPELTDRLTALDGVDLQQNVTPLDERDDDRSTDNGGRRRAARVRDWVRVDPTRWPVRLDAELAARIGQPIDGDGFASTDQRDAPVTWS